MFFSPFKSVPPLTSQLLSPLPIFTHHLTTTNDGKLTAEFNSQLTSTLTMTMTIEPTFDTFHQS